MCQAVSLVISCCLEISHAETLFLDEQTWKITKSHFVIGILVPWKMVPVSTENCLRQWPHFHTRRWLFAPVRVLRPLVPSFGVRK
jgi:hypothetical protein